MKNYWQDLEQLKNNSSEVSKKEKSEDGISLIKIIEDKSRSSRRDFLKLFGFTVASASVMSSCKKPVTKAIPYLVKPETITPGKADYYASTFYDGEQYGSILVKVRDGRPIKIEGNELSSLSNGSTSPIAQAAVLELYDDNRVQNPYIDKKETTWEAIDQQIIEALKQTEGSIVLLTSSIISPSTLKVIEDFKIKYPGSRHIMYDPVSVTALLDANERTFNSRVIPNYKFENAKTIVSFGADFLGNWISPVEFAKGYIVRRELKGGQKEMSRHIQVETTLSLTGSNADERIPIKPSEEKLAIGWLYKELLLLDGKPNNTTIPAIEFDLKSVARELYANRGNSLVVSGSNDVEAQLMINAINDLLGSYGSTIDITQPVYTKQGNDKELESLIRDMSEGNVGALLVQNANPAYELPVSKAFIDGMSKIPVSVSLATSWDETADLCKYVCPDSHFLESWNDAQPKEGVYSLAQPAIRTIFNTRQFQESLLSWSENNSDFHSYIKDYWRANLYQKSSSYLNFTDFWNHSLQDGIFETQISSVDQPVAQLESASALLRNIKAVNKEQLEIHFYENNTIGTGKHTNNPWLQETPDALSKVCWDNYAAISPKWAEDNDLEQGDVISLNNELEIPVLLQPGQKYGTISVAVGYGREKTGTAGKDVGVNIYPLVQFADGYRAYNNITEFSKTDKEYTLALTQSHNSMEGRPIIREASLEEYIEDPAAGNEMHEKVKHHLESLYPDPKFEGHHWGMAVDLNSCIGCNACVVGCTAENNVPVVGRDEVRRVHEMHWLRIDRYYAGDPENPEVARQPVMCQHCDNAPCENVCPVAATTHSNEGINQMAYNRCIGTRYCNNNCPYKVRRFNWYDYTQADALPGNTMDPAGMTLDLARMVLNPDVTVRAKGVMEKCSFCVQRIQEKKLDAKLDGRPIADGEIKTACMQACPTNAIVFGDLNDKDSKVAKLMKDKRNYHLLEEIHTLPSVSYLTKIRNKNHG